MGGGGGNREGVGGVGGEKRNTVRERNNTVQMRVFWVVDSNTNTW